MRLNPALVRSCSKSVNIVMMTMIIITIKITHTSVVRIVGRMVDWLLEPSIKLSHSFKSVPFRTIINEVRWIPALETSSCLLFLLRIRTLVSLVSNSTTVATSTTCWYLSRCQTDMIEEDLRLMIWCCIRWNGRCVSQDFRQMVPGHDESGSDVHSHLVRQSLAQVVIEKKWIYGIQFNSIIKHFSKTNHSKIITFDVNQFPSPVTFLLLLFAQRRYLSTTNGSFFKIILRVEIKESEEEGGDGFLICTTRTERF